MLQISELTYKISNKTILDSINFSIERGQHVALAGENGAGKSTLIKIILDLIRNTDSGRVTIAGKDSRQVDARGCLSYLPEKFDVKKEITGWQYLHFVASVSRQTWNSQRVEQLCEKLDLDVLRLSDKSGQYSKGMKQKLGLISCIMQDKELMILDEPLSGLDPKARYLFKRQLEEERASGRTLFYSTHMLADAEEICDRFGILHQGRMVFEGSPSACMERYQVENLEAAYMKCVGELEPIQ